MTHPISKAGDSQQICLCYMMIPNMRSTFMGCLLLGLYFVILWLQLEYKYTRLIKSITLHESI